MTTLYRFPGCTVLVNDDERWLVTTFPDGSTAHAHPNHDPESVARAHALGYAGDTWAMSRDHELAHHWLAYQAEHWQSFTLWLVAHPDLPRDDTVTHREESAVLRYQATIDKTTTARPWDPLIDPGR